MADQSRPVTGNRKATVYPFVSLPPNNQQNQRAYNSDPHSSRQRIIQDCSLNPLALILGTGVLGVIIWQIWLACIPYPHFYIQSLNVSNLRIDSWQISGVWDAHFTVQNPNSKISVYCDKIEVAVLYEWCSIATTTVPPFLQGIKNATAIRAEFPPSGSFSYDLEGEHPENSGKPVKFNVWMMVRVRPSAWGAKRTELRVFCHNLPIRVSLKDKVGTLVGGSKKCWVDNDNFVKVKPPEVNRCEFNPFRVFSK